MYIADLHCDTIMKIWRSRLKGRSISLRLTRPENGMQVDLFKLKKGGALVQNFAIFVDLKMPSSFDGAEGGVYMDPWFQLQEMVKVYHQEITVNADLIGEVRSYDNILSNETAGLMSAVLTVEEGGVLQGNLDRLQVLYDEGVRMMTLTWNYENELGWPNGQAGGLKQKGFEAVEEMTRLGILPDVSHLSDTGFYDLVKTIKGPFVASHSNARALARCSRNLTDDMIRIIGQHGGVIGLNFYPPFLEEADIEDHCRSTLEGLAKHAKHMMNIGGSEIVGLGTDFDGIGPENLEIEDASQMQILVDGLERAGLKAAEIEGICYKNVLKVYKEVL